MFTLTPEPVEVIEGDAVDLVCKAIGRPTPDITWSLDKQLLTEQDEHMTLSQSEEGDECSSTVTVNNLMPSKHAGKYTIEASNSVGTATHTLMVTG